MKALILNSGMGTRMGHYTKEIPKCMVKLSDSETILSRQLRMLSKQQINDIVMTTGLYHNQQKDYIETLKLPINTELVKNPKYNSTNYIHSIYMAKDYLDDDIVLLHGDMVFEEKALEVILNFGVSGMAVSTTSPLPDKDFKAVLDDGRITAVGIEFFENAVAAQPLYIMKKEDWRVWLDKIIEFCEKEITGCYAENAFNQVSHKMNLYPIDINTMLCQEIDKEEDLLEVQQKLKDRE